MVPVQLKACLAPSMLKAIEQDFLPFLPPAVLQPSMMTHAVNTVLMRTSAQLLLQEACQHRPSTLCPAANSPCSSILHSQDTPQHRPASKGARCAP